MGLLLKASTSETEQGTESSLDEMGKALKERIRRLPQKKTTPDTALSLLKAYGAFQSGICLALKNGTYSSYASVGLGVEKISIPQGKIWSAEKAGKKYFRLDAGVETPHINDAMPSAKNTKEELIFWIFPLDSSDLKSADSKSAKPWDGIMILGVSEQNCNFNPQAISDIISDIADKILIRLDQETLETSSGIKFAGLSASAIEEKINQFQQACRFFNCIILENPGLGNGGDKAEFCERVSGIIGMTGTVIPLSQGRPMILFPSSIDRELVVHRLSKNLKTRALLSCETNSPESVLNQIDSML